MIDILTAPDDHRMKVINIFRRKLPMGSHIRRHRDETTSHTDVTRQVPSYWI